MEELSKEEVWNLACKSMVLLFSQSLLELKKGSNLPYKLDKALLIISDSFLGFPIPPMPENKEQLKQILENGY